jgi:hypothetical protein
MHLVTLSIFLLGDCLYYGPELFLLPCSYPFPPLQGGFLHERQPGEDVGDCAFWAHRPYPLISFLPGPINVRWSKRLLHVRNHIVNGYLRRCEIIPKTADVCSATYWNYWCSISWKPIISQLLSEPEGIGQAVVLTANPAKATT